MATTPRHGKTPGTTVTPRKRLLRSPGATVPADVSDHTNDDEAEKQRRRVDRQNAASTIRSPHSSGSPGRLGAGTRPGIVGESGLSQSQLADHYASCIKLSSENKINSKNAFGLHLIDCMDEMLRQEGGGTNFQVAGCTLDASAKIYSGRVDSIYADTYKMLGGLAGQDRKPNEHNGEDGAPEGEDGQKRTKKTKKARHSRTVEQNVEALNVKKFDLEFEVDPLFSKTSATFDDGGPKGLLLNQLCTRGDTCEVILDSNAVVMPTVTETKAASTHDPQMTDLSRLRDHLHLLRLGSLEICPDFSEFLFMEEKANDSNSWSVHGVLASTTPSKARQQQEYRYEAGMSSDDNDNAAYDGAGDEGYAAGGDDAPGVVDILHDNTNLVGGGDATLPVTLPAQPGEQTMISLGGQGAGGSGNLMLSVMAEPSEYSYFDLKQMANWAGPGHWHLRPRSKADSSHVDGTTIAPGEKTRERTKRKPFEIDFTAKLNSKQLFTQSKATVLTKGTLSKQSMLQTTLPEDLHFNINELLQLFINPRWKLVRMEVPDDDKDHGGDMPWYNYKNERDCEGFCLPPGAAAVAANAAGVDAEGAGGCDFGAGDCGSGGDDYDDGPGQGDDNGGVAGAGSMNSMTMDNFASLADIQMQSFLDQTRADPSMLLGDNLVAQPKKVQRIQIDYAKAAKKMDVKKLKSGIWSVLTTPAQKENAPMPAIADEKDAKSDQCMGVQTFSSLYGTLPRKISSNMTKNLSVPIAFVCLLHLANEKNLKVTGVDGRSDLMVSQDT